MFKNLLRVSLRNLARDKWYSLLNILGLTLGITFSLFLIFYVKDELSFDRFHEKADRIYRINSYIKEPDKDTMHWAITQYPLGPVLKKDFPEVEEAVRFVSNGKVMYRNGDTRFYIEKVYVVDSNLFRVFTYPLLEGDPNTALVEPNSMVLTESVADKYFGKHFGIVGKTLIDIKGKPFKITGVLKDPPENSHIRFNILISNSTLPKDFADNWGGFGMITYVLLRPHSDPWAFQRKLLPYYDKYMASIFAEYKVKIHYQVQPITSIHLHSDYQGEPEDVGSMTYIYTFSAVALFMLLIACINYMNLTTARSARRAKEIGIRKVTGSSKRQLVLQFLMESTICALLALLISLGLIALLLPSFNTISGKHIFFGNLFRPDTLGILVCIIVFVGLAGGSYPAFYLSHFNPISVLKGSLSKSSSNATLRRVLIVLQFTISMTMLICTLVVYKQLQFLRRIDLGFDKAQVVTLAANTGQDISGKLQSFKDELASVPGVLSVSTGQSFPGANNNGFNLYRIETKDGYTSKGIDNYAIDENYFKTLGIKLVKGRNFTGLPDTLRSIIVNENMVKTFGWGNDPIGKKIKFPGDTSSFYLQVIGVVKDFNLKSLYSPIEPLLFFYNPNNRNLQVKLDGKNIPASLAGIEKNWKTLFPDLPFAYKFLDQNFDSQYEADQKRGKIFSAFSLLTVLITCLGLLGLISYITEQRSKEISIRKVMGAELSQIIPLLTRNFVFLVGLSCLIAFPVAYFFMNKWLKIFHYNTGITVSPFVFSALAVLFITLLTVMYHTVRAAMANPAKSLRTE
jgi:putative ABC transport system permease protein